MSGFYSGRNAVDVGTLQRKAIERMIDGVNTPFKKRARKIRKRKQYPKG